MGHEFVGVVEAAGSEVSSVKAGTSPFAWSDNFCDYCQEGFQTSCRTVSLDDIPLGTKPWTTVNRSRSWVTP
jgi:D-arabinose 1-dehydrogenase-like Zn-dependent alcohol dehydrogenase